MEKHLLQSREWGEYEKLEGKEVFEASGEGWSVVAWGMETPVGKYLMAGYGPYVEDEAAFEKALEGLRKLAEQAQALFVRIEPTFPVSAAVEAKNGLKRVKEIEPEHTWVLDLDRPIEEIFKEMESNKARSWRNMAKKGMSIRTTKDPEEISVLSRLLKGVGERDHFTPQDENHLKNQLRAGFATLYVVELEPGVVTGVDVVEKPVENSGNREKIPIAAALIYDYNGVRYYAHAAADDEYRKLRAGAVLVMQTIVNAVEQGSRLYDFWGVTTSEDPEHPWYGFTQFKKSFGGRQVDYGGTMDLVVKPGKYKIYEAMRKANLGIRKLKK